MATIAAAWQRIREQLRSQGWPTDVDERGGGLQMNLADDGRSVLVWLCDAVASYSLDASMHEADFNPDAEAWIFALGGAVFNRLPDVLVRQQGVEFETFIRGTKRG